MRKLIAIPILFALSSGLSAVNPDEFERIINFADTLSTVSEHVRRQDFERIDVDRYLILEGTVASILVFDPDPDTFQAVIELVASNWVGLERIEVHRVYVLAEGPEYARRLPDPVPSSPAPDVIRANQRLLVVGPFIGTAVLDGEHEVAVVQAIAVR